MSSAEHEGGRELDDELQRLFHDERLGVRPSAGAEQAIVAGAARVRRRRTVVAASGGAFAVAALALGGITLAAKPSEPLAVPPSSPPVSSAPAPPPIVAPPPPTPSSTTPTQGSSTPTPTPSTSATGDATPSESAGESSSAVPKGRVLRGTTLGPSGYGSLRLGMSVQAANSAGVTLTGANTGGTCQSYKFSGSGVPGSGSAWASADGTITTIAPSGSVHTPEGVGKGSTQDEVYAAYGGARKSGNTMTASAGSGASYVFRLGGGEVSGITLRSGGC